MMYWLATYDNSIQPKGRTAEFLAKRCATEYEKLGYITEIRQRGELYDVYTFPEGNVGSKVVWLSG